MRYFMVHSHSPPPCCVYLLALEALVLCITKCCWMSQSSIENPLEWSSTYMSVIEELGHDFGFKFLLIVHFEGATSHRPWDNVGKAFTLCLFEDFMQLPWKDRTTWTRCWGQKFCGAGNRWILHVVFKRCLCGGFYRCTLIWVFILLGGMMNDETNANWGMRGLDMTSFDNFYSSDSETSSALSRKK